MIPVRTVHTAAAVCLCGHVDAVRVTLPTSSPSYEIHWVRHDTHTHAHTHTHMSSELLTIQLRLYAVLSFYAWACYGCVCMHACVCVCVCVSSGPATLHTVLPQSPTDITWWCAAERHSTHLDVCASVLGHLSDISVQAAGDPDLQREGRGAVFAETEPRDVVVAAVRQVHTHTHTHTHL